MDEQRFIALWERCRAAGDVPGDPAAIFAEVHGHYASPTRHYHTPAHIDHCLRLFDIARGEMDDSDAVEMALWFHDVIYDLEAGPVENEQASANLFAQLVGPSVPEAFGIKVYSLIMITAHRNTPMSIDERFIVDIDLSSFGLPWADFRRDSVAVRREFPHLSDRAFFTKQRAFLGSLIEREHFCHTEFFRARHERQARENITRYVRELESM